MCLWSATKLIFCHLPLNTQFLRLFLSMRADLSPHILGLPNKAVCPMVPKMYRPNTIHHHNHIMERARRDKLHGSLNPSTININRTDTVLVWQTFRTLTRSSCNPFLCEGVGSRRGFPSPLKQSTTRIVCCLIILISAVSLAVGMQLWQCHGGLPSPNQERRASMTISLR